MVRLSLLLAALGVAACSFPTDGVPIGGEIDGGGDDDQDTGLPDANPPDACVPATETCEGSDEDCDGMIDEGFTSGAACDGPDADLCMDDMTVCDEQGAEVCGNTSGDDDPELCNAADDDCDGNMDEGFAIGSQCDGSDGDACLEGTSSCAPDGMGLVCSDATDTIVETCDGFDEDCDTDVDETFDLTMDVDNCGECGTQCTNALGTTSCVASTCTPVCSNGSAVCDVDPNDGCNLLNTDPMCATPTHDATVNGDQAMNNVAVLTGTTEAFVEVTIIESIGVTQSIPITARIGLVSGVGTDFDLHVYCREASLEQCGATPVNESDETIDVGRDDGTGNRNFTVMVEVRYDPTTAATTCNPWTLTITGHAMTPAVTNRCASPP